LKRAVAELSEKSDIYVTYEPIKEREVKKLEVSKVKFTIKKQKSILLNYDTQDDELNLDTFIVSDEVESPKSPEDIKIEEIARKRMEQAKLFGTAIKNERKYLDAIINKMHEEGIDISGMITIDNILDEAKYEFSTIKSKGNQLLVLDKFDPKYPVVAISREYLLYSPVDRVNITKTIADTINTINNFKNNGGKFKLLETPGYVNELDISYL
jgi:hypothetical protein